MDFEKMREKMREFFDSPEGKASVEKFKKSQAIKSDREEKMWNFLESLSQERFEELLSQFIL
jgi:hypothetical protein